MTAPTEPRLPGGGTPHPNPPGLRCDVTKHNRLVVDTPAHVRRDRWQACMQLDGVGSWRHHGDADQAEQITDWLLAPSAPLAVGSLARLDSRLTLEQVDADTVRVRVEYVIATDSVSTGHLTLPRGHGERWAGWLRQWLAAHPAPPGQLALFAHLSAAAAA